MRYFLTILFLTLVVVLSLAGFRGTRSRKPPLEIFPDMKRQAKPRPQSPSNLFPDQRSSHPFVEGTVARGTPFEETPIHTGRVLGATNFVEVNPLPVTAQLMARGQERFQIHCLPCHSPIGDGNGIITKYGLIRAGNFHDPRLIRMADGEIFNTITSGKNLMAAYASQVSITDRWAIIAYVRALELSRLGSTNEVPEPLLSTLKK